MTPVNPLTPHDRLDYFLVEVVDRLARIETKHDGVIARLDKLNGTVADDGIRISAHDKEFARISGAASIIAALVAAAVSAVIPLLRLWLGF
jgi:hypothetical protein